MNHATNKGNKEREMSRVIEKAKAWLAAVGAETPDFCKLCTTALRLSIKAVKKQDVSAEKPVMRELRAKTKNAQIAFGGMLVVFITVILMRGCGRNQSNSYVTYADAEMKKAVLVQVEQERQRAAKAEAEQKEAEEKRAAEETRREAADAAKKQKHEELGTWYRSERKKLDENKKIELSKLEKAKNNRAHDILVEHKWPQVKFPPLDDIIIAELLPEKYRSYALTQCPITIKNVPIFTSLRVDGASTDGIVDGMRLEGRIPMTVEMAIGWMQAMSKKLDESWGIKHTNLGRDQIFPSGEHEIAARNWEGLPKWHSLFQCQVLKTDDGSIAHFTLDINSYELPKLVREQLDKEFWKSVEKLEADFKAQEERLGEELHRRQAQIK